MQAELSSLWFENNDPPAETSVRCCLAALRLASSRLAPSQQLLRFLPARGNQSTHATRAPSSRRAACRPSCARAPSLPRPPRATAPSAGRSRRCACPPARAARARTRPAPPPAAAPPPPCRRFPARGCRHSNLRGSCLDPGPRMRSSLGTGSWLEVHHGTTHAPYPKGCTCVICSNCMQVLIHPKSPVTDAPHQPSRTLFAGMQSSHRSLSRSHGSDIRGKLQ